MTVKLWGVDRLHLPFDYHSESILSAFSLKCFYFLIILFMKLSHIQVLKKRMHEA